MKLDFNRDWKFSIYGTNNWKTVDLPHDAMILEQRTSSCLNGVSTGYFPGGRYLYRKEFQIEENQIGKRVALFFEGVYGITKVFFNGNKVAEHVYGYTEFEVDLSEIILCGKNEILIDVDNSYEPNSRWYSGSGIYRPVSLLIEEKNPIRDVKIETISYLPAVIRIQANQQVRVTIYDKKELIYQGSDGEITIQDAKLWDDEHPFLYQAFLQTETDAKEIFFGIRKIEYAPGKGLLINGQEKKLRGACIHHDNGVIGACEFRDAAYRRIRIMKEHGFNAIRSSHNPCSRAILDACDELGMYVMDETFDMWYKSKSHHDYAHYFTNHYEEDMKAMVQKDFNHPSVILYSVGNENGELNTPKGIAMARSMSEDLHALDQTRITTIGANLMVLSMVSKEDDPPYEKVHLPEGTKAGNISDLNGSALFNLFMNLGTKYMSKIMGMKRNAPITDELKECVDILGLNYATSRYDKDFRRDEKRMYVGSESLPWAIYDNWERVEKYHQLIGDFIWTGWDYIGEAGICGGHNYASWGKLPLLDGAGTIDITGFPTSDNYYVQICNGTYHKPYLCSMPAQYAKEKCHVGTWSITGGLHSWSYRGYEGKKVDVEVFGKGSYAELYLNGRKIGRKRLKKNRTKFKKVPYENGTLSCKVYDANGNLWGEDALETAGMKKQLKVSVDKKVLKADGQSLAFVDIELTDENGTILVAEDTRVWCELQGGKASLIGFGSARTTTDETFQRADHLTHYGRAQGVIRAGYEGGDTKVRVWAEGYKAREFTITVKEL